jgi:hypothetical protein
VRLNDEAREFRWVSIREALALHLNRPTRVLIEAVGKPGRAARTKKANRAKHPRGCVRQKA